MKVHNIFKKIVFALIAVFVGLYFSLCSFPIITTVAETTIYTDVLSDLRTDENFDESQYPSVSDDFSLQVIQIAESSDNELFVYVYQPAHSAMDLPATEIRLSTNAPDDEVISYKDYELSLISTRGVFDKYKIKDFTVKTDSVRYYNIVQIVREWDNLIDDDLPMDNTTSTVPYEVSQKWEVSTVDGKTTYRVLTLETITITDKFVGYVRYDEGFKLYVDSCDSHFVAFNTDRNMDKLLEADLTYVSRRYMDVIGIHGDGVPTYEDSLTIFKTLTYTDKASNDGDGLFGKKYTWERIQKTEDFLSETDETDNVTITKKGATALENTAWVLRFAETSFKNVSSGMVGSSTSYGTEVSDVTILRLKFETEGETYNLGVIDNKQTGSSEPVATVKPDPWKQFKTMMKKILKWIVIGFGIVILGFIVGLFGRPIVDFLWGLIKLPFRLIGKLFKWIGSWFKKKK